ncbi:MAG: O-antigen ligase family protein [Oscillospiraceae bacterium]|nr:O-antigen ligase family protein [Oscillospiraceae bacterium]
MSEQKTLKQRMTERLPLCIFVLCLIQPILDIAGYWQQTLGVGNAVTMALRMVLLGGTVLLGFLLSDRKRVYFLTAAILCLLTAGHVFACACLSGGYQEPVKDLVNLVRIYFLPMMTICFITFMKKNKAVFPAMMKGMVTDLLIIAGVQLISTLTGTDPHTYSVDKTGILGWFLWTNSQSAILAMLTPISICWALQKWEKRVLPVALITAISEATLFVLAPRLAYASLIGAGLGVAICLLLSKRQRWRQALAVALVTCLFVAAFPISPTHKRLSANDNRAEQTQQIIKKMDIHIEIVTEPASQSTLSSGETQEPGKTAPGKPVVIIDKKNAEKLEKLYRSQDILWSMVDRFGRDKVFEAYSYTLDPTILSNNRLMKIRFCQLLMSESGTSSKLFGLNLHEMTYSRYDKDGKLTVDNYDVENDLHGIYFLTGIVGLCLMLIFLLWFGVRALIAVIRDHKYYFKLPLCAFAIAYGLGLIHAYYTASVLRRNNASIYLAMVLAGLWYLSRKKESQVEENS